jgi:excisionase family DNA binding protein
MYTLGEAARAVGMSKPGIVKAIKNGRVSATRTDNGTYRIDPAELHRVYPLVGQPEAESSQKLTVQLRGELDKWRVLAEERGETIRDLRSRLDREGEERQRMTALLLLPPPVAPVDGQPNGQSSQKLPAWWRRLLRR